MSHALARVFIHAVWSTWQRTPWIDLDVENVIRRTIRDQAARVTFPLLAFGAYDDHVHVIFGLDRTVSIAEAVRSMKGASAHEVLRTGLAAFRWQDGYGAFSVDERDPGHVLDYVRNQRMRHASRDLVDRWEIAR